MRYRVLLVDDDDYVLLPLRRLFEHDGYTVRVASNGTEALAQLEEFCPDLLISDYLMPGINGVELLNEAKDRCPDAVRMLLTGHGSLEVAIDAIDQAKVYKLIRKPWDGSDLLVTARRALEHRDVSKKVVHAQKLAALGQVCAGIAHEINNPVGFVMCNMGILQEYIAEMKCLLAEYDILGAAVAQGDSCKQTQSLERIEQIKAEGDMAHLLRDVDDLLSESISGTRRIQEILQGLGRFAAPDESDPQEVEVDEAVRDSLRLVWSEMKNRCRVITEFGAPPPVIGYSGPLRQVIMNLLVNAAHAVSGDGEVRVETGMVDESVYVRVTDNGCGISSENLDRVCDPFYTTKPPGQGTGLGLSISYDIVTAHKGQLEIQSEVGAGTCVTICLPVPGQTASNPSAFIQLDSRRLEKHKVFKELSVAQA